MTTSARTEKKSVRIHLDLNPKCKDKLVQLSETTDTTLSEVLRRALALYDLIIEEKEKGGKIIIRHGTDDKEIVIL